MKILITGGYGFIGSYVTERFAKEGHEIFIIDDLSNGFKKYVKVKHNDYCINTADDKCRGIFSNNNIDIVIHATGLACLDKPDNIEQVCYKTNILGLANMLTLSAEYGVKKFIYISSIAVYGKTLIPATETCPIKPLSLSGIHYAEAENYCQRWRENKGLTTVVLRLANVYGPRQKVQSSLDMPGSLIVNMIDGQDIEIVGKPQDKIDYVYVEDVADAIYKAATSINHSTVLNVAAGSTISLAEIQTHLKSFGEMGTVKYIENPVSAPLPMGIDNGLIRQELGWQLKYSIADGLGDTYRWYQENRKYRPMQMKSKKDGTVAKVKEYLENIMLALFMGGLSYANLYGGIMDFWVGLDYNYVYIAIMGLMYGKRQSLLATLFSAIIFSYYMIARGADIVTLIYQVQYLTHFATYLCVGVVAGYITDNRDRIVAEKDAENTALRERYDFLQQMYDECLGIKDKLYSQIVNSGDSLGKIHSIAHELDSLRIEDIYTAAVGVVAKILKVKAVDIYTVNHDHSYLRLKVRSNDKNCFLPNSVKIADYPYVGEILRTKGVFVNKSLTIDYPSMAAPVVHEDKVIAIVQLYELPFEALSLYQMNLLKITTMLIAGSLARAYLHGSELRSIKYLPDTEILVPQEFVKVLDAARKRTELYNQSAALLRIVEKPPDYKQLYTLLTGVIRAEDYIGMKPDGYIYLLLSNISANMVEEVGKRLKVKGIFIEGIDLYDVA
ncbi:MAG: NAD-dependent epimerase/dehydratase family protein [Sporomusaceae bacterium]|nr:NAD-dependent epimerase/dehydratase family protein [Sporomusaceae bacterium]